LIEQIHELARHAQLAPAKAHFTTRPRWRAVTAYTARLWRRESKLTVEVGRRLETPRTIGAIPSKSSPHGCTERGQALLEVFVQLFELIGALQLMNGDTKPR
jgi:hypothetical protein